MQEKYIIQNDIHNMLYIRLLILIIATILAQTKPKQIKWKRKLNAKRKYKTYIQTLQRPSTPPLQVHSFLYLFDADYIYILLMR